MSCIAYSCIIINSPALSYFKGKNGGVELDMIITLKIIAVKNNEAFMVLPSDTAFKAMWQNIKNAISAAINIYSML